MLVIKNKYGNWNTPCSTKYEGSEVTYWLNVGWGRGKEPNTDKVSIKVKDFFLGAFKTQDGTAKPKMIVMEWEYEQKVTKAEDGNKYVNDGFSNTPALEIAPNDLPFY